MVSQPNLARDLQGFALDVSDISATLGAVDWNFSSRKRLSELENIHPYPAKFIPEIPGTLLDILPIPSNTAVLDPFVGSGTTLIECQKRGIRSVGIDLNPIACLISQIKTSPAPRHVEKALKEVLSYAKLMPDIELPDIPNLDHWFKRPISEAVERILSGIEAIRPPSEDLLRLALSSILVRISNQESDTRYAAVVKDVQPSDVYELFASAARKLDRAVQARDYHCTSSIILERDTLSVKPSEIGCPIGAVITSPPYPNAYEYWLYHKYRMWWLGYDPVAVKSKEIGARAHFFKANHHTADHFVEQMRGSFALIADVLVAGGFVCFVVGRSKIHGTIVDNAQIIQDIGHEFDFRTVFRTERMIAASRKTFNLSHANIKTETLLVLSR
ncbi:DNA methyltransferase [Methylobacterium indicum]|uniref:DNA methyltransferase C1 n=1 Tax=Methylobacterium indicum TaxID=1775910 RepID=A0A8H8X0T9_9HYPH|nr:DNA methyltransferase [Methylobacterium indicum]BCM88035.1 DNA methyltransferase C1 [Methylobacterium indicum]